jgi:23S rRNA (cytidine1920-2'-O)/16S rRNA (cytidine1409-2'-O)-methyltransferase
MRADLFLVERGHAATRSQAQRLIASGVLWREGDAPWKKIAKNGDEVPAHAELQLTDTAEARYLSRGGLKLEGALVATGLQVAGWRCLDLGQSTGGFTDCLLQQGAARVVGIDVGHGQLHASLRGDARVVCIEGVNARALTLGDFWAHHDAAVGAPLASGHEPFDLLTGDLSFISLTLVLPAMVRLLKLDAHALLLVKPQFELQPGQVGKGGIVKDPALFALVQERLRDCCDELGLQVLAWLDSPIAGGDGNREFFIHARRVSQTDAPLPDAPARQTPKRQPRSERRQGLLDEGDRQSAHDGQPGPAKRKRKN